MCLCATGFAAGVQAKACGCDTGVPDMIGIDVKGRPGIYVAPAGMLGDPVGGLELYLLKPPAALSLRGLWSRSGLQLLLGVLFIATCTGCVMCVAGMLVLPLMQAACWSLVV